MRARGQRLRVQGAVYYCCRVDSNRLSVHVRPRPSLDYSVNARATEPEMIGDLSHGLMHSALADLAHERIVQLRVVVRDSMLVPTLRPHDNAAYAAFKANVEWAPQTRRASTKTSAA